jgi:hypothetical protein
MRVVLDTNVLVGAALKLSSTPAAAVRPVEVRPSDDLKELPFGSCGF